MVASLLVASGLLGLASVPGCGKSIPSGTVTGKVTLDGKPVPEGCGVMFIADKFTATGQVGAGGSYTLFSAGKPSVPAATYKVAITPPTQQMSNADYEKMMATGSAPPEASKTSAVPEKYGNAATSALSFEVKEGPNTINIELK
jgi:hypothetical protein